MLTIVEKNFKMPLDRVGWMRLVVGATAGVGLIALVIYREITRRRAQAMLLESKPAAAAAAAAAALPPPPPPPHVPDCTDRAELAQVTPDGPEVEAQEQARAAVEAVVQGLSPEQQLEVRNQLDQVLNCVATLRSEVAELRGSLQDIAVQIIQDVKKGVEDSQRIRRRRHLVPRERTESNSSSSIYFSASQGLTSSYEGETSEGGYSTAYAESDYTDRETDRDEASRGPEPESEEEEEEEEEKSSATVLTLRHEGSDESDDDEERGPQEEEVGGRRPELVVEIPSGELALLLAQSDILHTGDASLKAEGFRLLLENRAEHGDSKEFLWRLARAYTDMCKYTEDLQERRAYTKQGREEAEIALKKNDLSAECHKWFAVLVGLNTEHETIHGKLKNSYILKEHLDRALALQDDDPLCFYLLGRWCYEIATHDWMEKKTAHIFYNCTPSSSRHDALENFLKAEELSPGFSKAVRLYIAKCHNELGNISEARNWVDLAMKTPSSTKDNEEEMSNLVAQLCGLLNNT